MTQYIEISAGLDDTDITVDDHEYEGYDGKPSRSVSVNVGRVRLMCGGSDEANRIAALDRLITAATTLRFAAMARQEAATLPDGVEFVGTVGGFLGETGTVGAFLGEIGA